MAVNPLFNKVSSVQNGIGLDLPDGLDSPSRGAANLNNLFSNPGKGELTSFGPVPQAPPGSNQPAGANPFAGLRPDRRSGGDTGHGGLGTDGVNPVTLGVGNGRNPFPGGGKSPPFLSQEQQQALQNGGGGTAVTTDPNDPSGSNLPDVQDATPAPRGGTANPEIQTLEGEAQDPAPGGDDLPPGLGDLVIDPGYNSPAGQTIFNNLQNPEEAPGFKLGQNLITERGVAQRENLNQSLERSGIAGSASGVGIKALSTLNRQGDIDIGNLALSQADLALDDAIRFEEGIEGRKVQREAIDQLDRASKRKDDAAFMGALGGLTAAALPHVLSQLFGSKKSPGMLSGILNWMGKTFGKAAQSWLADLLKGSTSTTGGTTGGGGGGGEGGGDPGTIGGLSMDEIIQQIEDRIDVEDVEDSAQQDPSGGGGGGEQDSDDFFDDFFDDTGDFDFDDFDFDDDFDDDFF